MVNLKIFALLILLAYSLDALSRTTTKLWPKPANFTYDTAGTQLLVAPCSMKFTINGSDTLGVQLMVNLYQINVFGCSKTDQTNQELVITVANAGQYIATDVKQ